MERPSLLSNAEVESLNQRHYQCCRPAENDPPIDCFEGRQLAPLAAKNDVPVSNRHKLTVEKLSASSKLGNAAIA